ncbi:MAG: 4'-phosphopantetheinyl transferase superfamily protein, partial [Clostridia bacterium]|nr:4'-phosphopantetheinyl transferase superfamily protein [Clostridia bacterium]
MKRDRIAVYVSDISSREFSEEKINLLESARREKILTAESAEYKKTSLFAGLLIRAALSEEGAAVSPSLPLFVRYGTFGKPYIDGQKRFSIIPSGNIVAVAVADFEIGLDVEKVREIDHDDLSRRALSLGEIRDLTFLSRDEKSEKFLSFWTAKEAYFKYLGTGVN